MTAATLNPTGKASLTALETGLAALGALLAALAWGVAAAQSPAAAEQIAPKQLVQESGPPDSDDRQPHSLDPWNVEIRDRPVWDPRNAPPQLQNRAKRHLEFLQAGVPVEYRSQSNPYPNVTKAITDGGAVYRANCVACHGPNGRGDGDAGLDLVPSPALLSEMMDKQGTVDEYLLWTISEGGKPFDTAMPAFKNRLTENQIWQVIIYLRAGFPPAQP
jgi:mono/diheme cytochrome c family protein